MLDEDYEALKYHIKHHGHCLFPGLDDNEKEDVLRQIKGESLKRKDWDHVKIMKKSLGDYSYNDLRSELQFIIQQKYGKQSSDAQYWSDYPYIVDVYEDEFVVEKAGMYYIAGYKVDKEGGVTIGEFYNARKIYRQTGKTPVIKMGKRTSKILVER